MSAARFPAKTGGKEEERSPLFCGASTTSPRHFAPDVKNPRRVTLTSRRRVRSPDWRRERRHAQKGRGTRERGGPRRRGLAVQKARVDGEQREERSDRRRNSSGEKVNQFFWLREPSSWWRALEPREPNGLWLTRRERRRPNQRRNRKVATFFFFDYLGIE